MEKPELVAAGALPSSCLYCQSFEWQNPLATAGKQVVLSGEGTIKPTKFVVASSLAYVHPAKALEQELCEVFGYRSQ